MILAPQMMVQADTNRDQKVAKDELVALADAWFDKLDPDKGGKLSQDDFNEGVGGLLPPPPGLGPPGERPGQAGPSGPGRRRGGFGPAMFIGPGLFTATDANKDGSLTRAEWKGTFAQWHAQWAKAGSVDEAALRDGLNTALPQPAFGGRGGPGRGPGMGGGQRVEGAKLDPLVAASDPDKPLISKLLAVPALHTRYLQYVRDIAEKWLDWNRLGPIAESYHSLIAADIEADTKKLDSNERFAQGLDGSAPASGGRGGAVALKSFADQRRAYLLSHPEVKKAP
jgi:hypothetical protein